MTLISRAAFVDDVRRAAEEGRAWATGKIGVSERRWMYLPMLLDRHPTPRQRVAYAASLSWHCRSTGVYPHREDFYLRFNEFYNEHLQHLDCVGICCDSQFERDVVAHYTLKRTVHYLHQEPDRSAPAKPELCYLPAFAGKRLLIVCPFARMLRARANEATFERVWSNIGKRWFHPASVDALEFPYGFEPATQAVYPTALDLYESIAADLEEREFDIALIAAAGLSIPIASKVKSLGKIGISLGGHLQVLFGVIGTRWRDRPEWKSQYFNDAWVDMPADLRPANSHLCDFGSYW